MTGFRGRSGRNFRAKLKLEQVEEGKWRVDFDEEWAKEPPKGEAEEERAEAESLGGLTLGRGLLRLGRDAFSGRLGPCLTGVVTGGSLPGGKWRLFGR